MAIGRGPQRLLPNFVPISPCSPMLIRFQAERAKYGLKLMAPTGYVVSLGAIGAPQLKTNPFWAVPARPKRRLAA